MGVVLWLTNTAQSMDHMNSPDKNRGVKAENQLRISKVCLFTSIAAVVVAIAGVASQSFELIRLSPFVSLISFLIGCFAVRQKLSMIGMVISLINLAVFLSLVFWLLGRI